jgi:hypothetical protein
MAVIRTIKIINNNHKNNKLRDYNSHHIHISPPYMKVLQLIANRLLKLITSK